MKAYVIKRDDGKYVFFDNNLVVGFGRLCIAELYSNHKYAKCDAKKLNNYYGKIKCKVIKVEIKEIEDE